MTAAPRPGTEGLRRLPRGFWLYVALAVLTVHARLDPAAVGETGPPTSWENEVVTTYAVVSGDLGPRLSGPRDPAAERLWAEAEQVFPQPERALVVELSVLDPCHGCPAGYAQSRGDGSFVLAVNTSYPRRERHDILLHEFAHVVAQGGHQLTRARPCATYREAGDCYRSGGYLGTWVDRFWWDLLRPDRTVAGATGTIASRREVAERRYAGAPWRFVDPWAAATPHEDFADTLSAWARGLPATTVEVGEKYRLLESWPALREIRVGAARAGWTLPPPGPGAPGAPSTGIPAP